MYYGSNELKSYTDIANGFNDFFKSVFKSNTHDVPYCKTRETPIFHLNDISPDEMLDELNSIKQTTSTGSDNLSATFIRKCADRLCHPLCIIFNLSLSTGEYPDIFKRNNIITIYKQKGS